jgi:hypothetical protein
MLAIGMLWETNKIWTINNYFMPLEIEFDLLSTTVQFFSVGRLSFGNALND